MGQAVTDKAHAAVALRACRYAAALKEADGSSSVAGGDSTTVGRTSAEWVAPRREDRGASPRIGSQAAMNLRCGSFK